MVPKPLTHDPGLALCVLERFQNVNLARARVAVQIDQPVQALDLDLCQVQALVLQDVSAGLSPALAFGREARRRQDSWVRPRHMVRMMIPPEGAAKNIAMFFAGLPVDGR